MTSIPNYRKKILPNERCPCGSGKKYKKCHRDADASKTDNPYQIDGQIRSLRKSNQCLVPDAMTHECTKGTISAHTVSRSGSLGVIEKNGHVYSYNISLASLTRSSGKMSPVLTGWKNASTFPGFCALHDKKIFEPLEDEKFMATKEQCFLLAYRCVVREYYAKMISDRTSSLRQALANASPEATDYMSDFNLGVELGLRDSLEHKRRYDDILLSKNWDNVNVYLVEFDGVFPIQCAGGFFPTFDIFGQSIQDLGIGKAAPDAMTIVSFAADSKSYLSFCWLRDSDASCNRFIDELKKIPAINLPAVLGSLLLQTSENCHFSPVWYDNLSSLGKEWCSEQMHVGTNLFMSAPPPASYQNVTFFKDVKINSIQQFN